MGIELINLGKKSSKYKLLLPFGTLIFVLSGCAVDKPQPESKTVVTKTEHINTETKFSSKEYGVAGSPRVTSEKRTRKGGGRFQIGKPYKIRGKWYKPKEDPSLNEVGLASWYGPNFHGRLTANGEIYDQYGISAAHPTMPLPSYATVTNLENGRKITVRVNDRGPYAHGRVIDLSAKAAELLGYTKQGVAKVRVQFSGLAQMDGLDEQKLLASYEGPGAGQFNGSGGLASGTMIAMAEPQPQTSAAAAIDQTFVPESSALAGRIPVPVERPTLFEGVPLAKNEAGGSLVQDVEKVIYKPADTVLGRIPRPMAYAEEGLNIDSLAYAYHPNPSEYISEYSSSKVTIVIGMVLSEAQPLLQSLVRQAGSIQDIGGDGQLILITTEQHANQVVGYLREIGFIGARIQ